MEIGHQGSVFALQTSSQSSSRMIESKRGVILVATSALALLSLGYLLRSYWFEQPARNGASEDETLSPPISWKRKETSCRMRCHSFPVSPSIREVEETSEKIVKKSDEITPEAIAEKESELQEQDKAAVSIISIKETPLIIPDETGEHEEEYELVYTDGEENLEDLKNKNSWDVYKAIKVFLGTFRI